MTDFDPDELATGLIRVRPDGAILAINRAAGDLLGPAAARQAGRSLQALSPQLGNALTRASGGEGPLAVPELALRANGRSIDAFFHRSGETILIELHPVAERIRQRRMADRADREQAVALMSRRLAHELRNPLAGVRGASQLIGAGAESEAVERHAAMIQREVDRIVALIEEFAGGGQLRFTPVNIHRIIDEVAELAAAESGGRVALERDFDASIPKLLADGSQIHRMLLNLVRNGIQAEATAIRFITRIEHDCPLLDDPSRRAVSVTIEDDGLGVPKALRDRLFLPLVSGRGDGTGFGLAIVQQIARAHGGLVEYEPLATGSRFRVHLPLIPAGDDHD
ncbi:MAG: two-component system sensor histidine kinase NtrB [Wenzhouxiangella sp.]